MTSIKGTMAALRTIRANYAQAAETVNANWRLSDAAKREQLDGFRLAERESVVSAARTIFGDKGLFWLERDALKGKLRDARDVADTMDPARLSNTYRRVNSFVASAVNVSELAEWYSERADSYERRALQDTGAEPIVARFGGQPELGGMLAMLKRDRAAAMATPEVRALEDSVALLEQDAYNAHRELWQHSGETGNPWQAERVLRTVRVDMRFDDVSRADARARYTVERAPELEVGGYVAIKEG